MKHYRIELFDDDSDKKIIGEVSEQQIIDINDKFGIDAISILISKLQEDYSKLKPSSTSLNDTKPDNIMNPIKLTTHKKYMVWDDLFAILAWKFTPTKNGDMMLDGETVYNELKDKFTLTRKK